MVTVNDITVIKVLIEGPAVSHHRFFKKMKKKRFMKHLGGIMRGYQLESDILAVKLQTYVLLLDYYGSLSPQRFSHKFLQAAGIRVIDELGIRTGWQF